MTNWTGCSKGLQPARPVTETTETTGDESIISLRKKKVSSKKTFMMKKAWASDEPTRLFVTGPTYPFAKPRNFLSNLSA